jgi:hypothetical protein
VSTPPHDGGPSTPFTREELADLQAGLLSTEEEKELRMRMEEDPAAAHQMLADLAAVDEAFPDPAHVNEPLDVPPVVAAGWQLAIAREAQRRAMGYPPGSDDEDGPAAATPRPNDAPPDGRADS